MKRRYRAAIAAIAVAVLAGAVANADDAQVNEAAVVFDGVKPSEMRGGTWKVVYLCSRT